MLTSGLRSTLHRLPHGLQRRLNWRLRKLLFAPSALRFERRWNTFDVMAVDERRQWLFEQVRAMAVYAQENNPFYARYYRENGFDARDLASFDDLPGIPMVTKGLLRDAGAEWLQPDRRSAFANTGGTSGNPLRLCSGRRIWVKEEFHIAKVWARLGCDRRSSRAVFRGLNLGRSAWSYLPQDDAYYVNTYRSYKETADDLHDLFTASRIEFLHGYPSAIYRFALHCQRPDAAALRQAVTRSLRGVLLGSEYPAPQYRDVIEETFTVPTLSWYGHSEMTVLAAETDRQAVYEPLHTYGYSEAVRQSGGSYRLVGTSLDNFCSPFIRYDTEDSIEPVGQAHGLLQKFRITEGRLGEFVVDRKGTYVSLTALVFGRHHRAFDLADFVQVSQERPGFATFHVTTSSVVDPTELPGWFDTDNVDITFRFESRSLPWRTASGKVPLLIPSASN